MSTPHSHVIVGTLRASWGEIMASRSGSGRAIKGGGESKLKGIKPRTSCSISCQNYRSCEIPWGKQGKPSEGPEMHDRVQI